MRISLVKPFNKFSYSFTPPLGLGYIASMLRINGGHKVTLFEATRDKCSSIKSFYSFLIQKKPYVVGIQMFSVDILIVKEYLDCIKEIDKKIITVLGGPHPSAIPHETMDLFGRNLDFIITGEGEENILMLANKIEEKKSLDQIPGLVWRDEEGRIIQNKKEMLKDINNLPWPDWELLKPTSYPHAPLGGISKNFPVAPVIVSRGCPMNCNFCGGKVIYLRDKFGIREIMIQDDNLTFRKNVVLEFCQKIKYLQIDWNCLNGIRLDFIDEEIVSAMKDAGCYAVAVGIESGSQKILDDMNKKLKLEQIKQKINILSKYKMQIVGEFIIGYPTETKEDILKTIEFAKSLPIDRAAFANFMPLPGSYIYNQLKEEGRLNNCNYGDMSYYKVSQSFTSYVSTNELDILLKKAIRSFHLRPLILYKTVKNIGSFSNFLNLCRRFVKNYL